MNIVMIVVMLMVIVMVIVMIMVMVIVMVTVINVVFILDNSMLSNSKTKLLACPLPGAHIFPKPNL